MAKRMLIDATHPEETRVVVISGTRLEEFDLESSTKQQIKGNIYLAKVVRVEPSLQAAFIDYGGPRHGFLSFTEIHPDYYQIPIADREALLKEEAEQAKDGDDGADEPFDIVGGDEAEEIADRRARPLRHYKIQEVIKRRQILLVQVVKEERGNKGAALTTYLSLAGRYCVLMPNTARGGGISRKITNPKDRKRLKSIVGEFRIEDGMAVIVRTAGSERTKAEIGRDHGYLTQLWRDIRENTLSSTAPTLIYEEANIIKRAIRDLYSKEIDEIVVDGDEAYKYAKELMKTMIPSHAKKVQPYRDPTMPMLHRYRVESQLDEIHSPTVRLKSGGYIVLAPTEALVSIDVNSGRATRERHIEETALNTNIEAADEIARQLRLRDLAGLIVIDFIDMEDRKNVAAVERCLKEAMRHDRARSQLGRISAFGLLELSRQRLRPSLVETSNQPCPACGGSGYVRSIESTALHILRAIEEEGIRRRSKALTITVPTAVALYVLNQKRDRLREIEASYGFRVTIASDDSLIPPDFRLDRVKAESADEKEAAPEAAEPAAAAEAEEPGRRRQPRSRRAKREEPAPAAVEAAEPEAAEAPAVEAPPAGDEAAPKKRRRRGKRGGRRRGRRAEAVGTEAVRTENAGTEVAGAPIDELVADDGAGEAAAAETTDAKPAAAARPERRSRRRPSRTAKPAPAPASAPTPADNDGGNGAEPEPEPAMPARVSEVIEEPPFAVATPGTEGSPAEAAEPSAGARRRGWWQRLSE